MTSEDYSPSGTVPDKSDSAVVLSAYHKRYINLPVGQIVHGLKRKEHQLRQVFDHLEPVFENSKLRVSVLGCADRRFVKGHKELFSRLLQKPVELTTFDITTEHLRGEQGVVEHDCTEPLPGGPYDVIFSHILLKFIPGNQQWLVIENSYKALRSGGIAIHVMDVGGKSQPTRMLKDGFYDIDLKVYKEKLKKNGIKFETITVKKGADNDEELECLILLRPSPR